MRSWSGNLRGVAAKLTYEPVVSISTACTCHEQDRSESVDPNVESSQPHARYGIDRLI